MRFIFTKRPICLPDEEDLALDLTRQTGTAVGWGLQAVLYEPTTCDYVQGVADPASQSTKPKKLHLE